MGRLGSYLPATSIENHKQQFKYMLDLAKTLSRLGALSLQNPFFRAILIIINIKCSPEHSSNHGYVLLQFQGFHMLTTGGRGGTH